MSLAEICKQYNSDKGWYHSYIPQYERLLSAQRTRIKTFLEIGVLYGQSLKMWRDYLPDAHVYGIDDFSQDHGVQGEPLDAQKIRDDLVQQDRITFLEGDCENKEVMDALLGDLEFQFIVDDGSHSVDQQVANLKYFLPKVAFMGMYVCEDVSSPEAMNKLFDTVRTINCGDFITEQYNGPNTSDDRMFIARKV